MYSGIVKKIILVFLGDGIVLDNEEDYSLPRANVGVDQCPAGGMENYSCIKSRQQQRIIIFPQLSRPFRISMQSHKVALTSLSGPFMHFTL